MAVRSVGLTAKPLHAALVVCTFIFALVATLVVADRAAAAPTFLTALDMSDPGQDALQPDVAVSSSGATMVVFIRNDGANYRVQARYRDAAGSLGPVDTLSAAGETASQP